MNDLFYYPVHRIIKINSIFKIFFYALIYVEITIGKSNK